MGKLLGYSDTTFTCWSRMELANGDPIWISVARAGVIVKRSRMGLMGAKLYDERNAYKAAMTAKALDAQIVGYTTPSDMTNPVLRALTQAALDCESAAAVSVRFNEALTKSSQS